MLINYEKIIQNLLDIKQGNVLQAQELGIADIDQYLRFKQSNFNLILGHANVGKTTVALYLMLLYTIKHKKRWLVFSSENEPDTLIKRLIEFIEKKPLTQISDKAFKKQSEYVYKYFKFIDNNMMFSYSKLLELATHIKSAWDCNGFFIDPYNSLQKDNQILKNIGGHEYDYNACTEFRMFCKKYQITIWLNTHANTEALRKKHSSFHEYSGHPIPPMASDVEGGGKFVNRADDFMVIHRYVQHPTDYMYNLIHIRKVKEIETGGRPTPLEKPIKIKALPNNVGFTINGIDLLDIVKTPDNTPF